MAGMRDDLIMWQGFFDSYNGISFLRDDLLLEDELQVMSDAVGTSRFGVFFRGHWCTDDWPQEWFQAG